MPRSSVTTSPRSSRRGPGTRRSRARTRRSTAAPGTPSTSTSRTIPNDGIPIEEVTSNERRTGPDVRRLRPQGAAGRAAALPRERRRRSSPGAGAGSRRLHVPPPRLLRAGRVAQRRSTGSCGTTVRVDPELVPSLHLITRWPSGKPNRPIRPRGGGPEGRAPRRDRPGRRPAPGRASASVPATARPTAGPGSRARSSRRPAR